ncbi:HutD/Ves family protein [Luteimonas sp. SDU82]|uniref:HutD/Ves family protein n=1 Tax=Luteimonas sp. SDU82 TaxID=3422592 RepID=UPI003EC11352
MGPVQRMIPANEYRRLRWKNQLGWTREIHAEPDTDCWRWRISIAELDGPAPFSAFPGIARELVLLRGERLQLRFDDGEDVVLRPPCGRLRFDGARGLAGHPQGHCEAFNLMWRPDAVSVQLWHRPLAGALVSFVDPGTVWIVHLLTGHARMADGGARQALEAGDTAMLSCGGTRARHAIEGRGEALLVRIDHRAG